MRNSEIIFFSTMILSCLVALAIMIALLFDVELKYQYWMTYWWMVILAPMALSKALFPNSKFTKWLEKKYESKKNKG